MATPKPASPPATSSPAPVSTGEGKAARHTDRSPNYPAIGFKRSVELAKKVYDAEKKHTMSKELAVKHMGYTFNGRSKLVLSAVKKHGLMEEEGDKLKISDAAVALMVYPAGHPERVKQERLLALRPKMFKQILAKYPAGLPSDENLKASLQVEDGFTASAADTVVTVLKEAMEVAGVDGSGKTSDTVAEDAAEDAPEDVDDMETDVNDKGVQKNPPPPPPKPGMVMQAWDLGGDVLAELRFNAKPNAKQIEMLKRYVELFAATREE